MYLSTPIGTTFNRGSCAYTALVGMFRLYSCGSGPFWLKMRWITDRASWAAFSNRAALTPENGETVIQVVQKVRPRLRRVMQLLPAAWGMIIAGGAIGVAPLLEDTLGGLRLATTSDGLSRRAWVAALPVIEAGGLVEALAGAFPRRWEPALSGVIVASTPDELEQIRSSLL